MNNGLAAILVRSLAVSGTNLFAGTQAGGVFLSTDNGSSWTAVNSGLTNRSVLSLAVSGSNLFAGTDGGGVFINTTILTGIEEEAKDNFKINIYPNPSTGNFSINLYQPSPVSEVIIMNALGQEVSRAKYSNTSKLELDIKGESGFYFVRIATREKSEIFKVVKL